MHKVSEWGDQVQAQLVDFNPVATIVIDAQHLVTHWNRACAALTGVAAEEMLGRSEQWRAFYNEPRPIMADFVVDDASEAKVASHYDWKFARSALIPGAFEAEKFFPAFGQGGRWLFITAAAIRNDAGDIVGAIETLQDVTERHLAEEALRDKESCLGHIVDGSSVATLVIDARHRVTHWNRACEMMTGVAASDMIGKDVAWKIFYTAIRPILADLVLEAAEEGVVDRLYHGRYRRSTLIEGGYEAEDFFPHFGDDGRWLYFTAAPLRDADGKIIGAIETLQDVTARRRAEVALRESEERYRRLSLTDSLTGLFNFRHMHQRLHSELERAQRYGRPLSLLILDCDYFKEINDNFGHLEGDKVLVALARIIGAALRGSDCAFRYGGEEFTVLLPETSADAASQLAERLRLTFGQHVEHAADGRTMSCTVSIGIAESQAGETSTSLIRRADQAAYRAKECGRNRVMQAD